MPDNDDVFDKTMNNKNVISDDLNREVTKLKSLNENQTLIRENYSVEISEKKKRRNIY